MNNLLQFLRRNRNILFLVLSIFIVASLLLLSNRDSVVKPLRETGSSSQQAQLFNASAFYQALDQNDNLITLAQKDVATFAHKTAGLSENELVGFTFIGNPKDSDDTKVFEGKLYGVEGKIQLKVTNFGKGIARLSITNLTSDANIDEFLELNGPKNRLLEKLPVDKDLYSIRYLYSDNTIIVSFYEGFTRSDIDSAVMLLKEVYGQDFKEDLFRYSINGVGTTTLEGVYGYELQN